MHRQAGGASRAGTLGPADGGLPEAGKVDIAILGTPVDMPTSTPGNIATRRAGTTDRGVKPPR